MSASWLVSLPVKVGGAGAGGAAVVHFMAQIINNSCQANLYTLDSFVFGVFRSSSRSRCGPLLDFWPTLEQ